jgi:hypothetical protein
MNIKGRLHIFAYSRTSAVELTVFDEEKKTKNQGDIRLSNHADVEALIAALRKAMETANAGDLGYVNTGVKVEFSI